MNSIVSLFEEHPHAINVIGGKVWNKEMDCFKLLRELVDSGIYEEIYIMKKENERNPFLAPMLLESVRTRIFASDGFDTALLDRFKTATADRKNRLLFIEDEKKLRDIFRNETFNHLTTFPRHGHFGIIIVSTCPRYTERLTGFPMLDRTILFEENGLHIILPCY